MSSRYSKQGRLRAYVLALLLLLAVAMVIGWPMLSPLLPIRISDAAKTERTISQVYMYVASLLSGGRFHTDVIAPLSGSGDDINSLIAAGLLEAAGSELENVKTRNVGEPFVCDAWGRPLRMELVDRTSGSEPEAQGLAVSEKTTLLVWSLGENGVDDDLRGDDVLFYAPGLASQTHVSD